MAFSMKNWKAPMRSHKARWVVLYINHAEHVAEVHVHRIGDHLTGDRVYRVHGGDPSAARLGRLLAGRKHVCYPAQCGWGVTPLNGRPHSVYTFEAQR